MASQYKKVKRYTGVYYSESKVNTFRGRPDRTYWINFRDFLTKKLRWERCGKASDGWTPEATQNRRIEILEKNRVGKYKPSAQRKKELLTVNQFMQQYYLPSITKPRHLKDVKSRYKNWIKDEIAQKTLTEVTGDHIENILNKMNKKARALSTQEHVVKLIRHIFNQAIERDHFNGKNPCAGTRFTKKTRFKYDNKRTRFLSKSESEQLLSEIRKRSVQTAQIATLSLYSGMRLGEILSLRWRDVDLEHDIITVLDPKNGESRSIFMTGPIKSILNELDRAALNMHLFANKHGQPVKFLSNSFDRSVTSLKLNEGISDRRQRVSFHSLRHTYASWAIMAGVPLFQVGKALGHKSTVMTERYSHLAPDSQRVAFDAVAAFSEKQNITDKKT